MPKITENDLSKLEELIISSQKALDKRLIGIENSQTEIKERLTVIEQGQIEIKQQLQDIDQRLTVVENSQTQTTEKLQEIDKCLTIIDTRLEDWKPSINKITDLAEKVGELKNWRQIVIIALTALISGSITWVIRGGNLKP